MLPVIPVWFHQHKHVFSLKEVATEDVVPYEKIDAAAMKYLECMLCDWKGWTDEYWNAKEGIVPLFNDFKEGIYEDID